MIRRRSLRQVFALLLPLMVARALVPDGYMLTAESGRLQMVVCSAAIARWSAPALSSQHDIHHDHQHGHDHEQQHDGNPSPAAGEDCPFAHAALNAPPPHLLAFAAADAPEFRFVSRYADQLPPPTGPPRQTSARAPPISARSYIV